MASHLPAEVQWSKKMLLQNGTITQAQRRRRVREREQSSTSDSKPSSSSKRGKKRRKTRFTEQQRDVLSSWLIQNRHHPYPSLAEKEEISSSTGLSKRQIEVWYSNARKRYERPQSPLTVTGQNESLFHDGQTPLERYLSSEEDEPADPDAIARALAKSTKVSLDNFHGGESGPTAPLASSTTTGPYSPCDPRESHCIDQTTCTMCKTYHLNPCCVFQEVVEPSTADNNSFEYAWHEECSSIPTNRSMSSIASAVSFGSRQGRRRHGYHSPAYGPGLHRPQSEPQIASLGNCLPHFCALCSKAFKSASDRRRHENSVHNGTERWICKLHEIKPPLPTRDDGSILLWKRCALLSEEKRTFYRKDKLMQHLRNTHRLGREIVHELPLNAWVSGRCRPNPPEGPLKNPLENPREAVIEASASSIWAKAPPIAETNGHCHGLYLSSGTPPLISNGRAASATPIPKPVSRSRPPATFTLGGSSGEEDEGSPEGLNNLSLRHPCILTKAAEQMAFRDSQARESIWVNRGEKKDATVVEDCGSDVVIVDDDDDTGSEKLWEFSDMDLAD